MKSQGSGSLQHLGGTRLLTLVWVVCLLVLGAYVLGFSIGRTTQGFIAYYAASRLLVTGHFGPWVYDDAWFMRYVQDITGTRIVEIFGPNTPTMALLALPLVVFGPSGARALWIATSFLGLALASALLVRHAIRRNESAHAVFVALMLLSPAVFANLRTGQAYLLVFAAFTAAALCLVRQQDVRAGVVIGVTLMLKSSGLPLLVLLVAQRRVRAVVAAVSVCGTGAVLLRLWVGPEIWPRYLAYVWEFVQRPSTSVTAYQTTRSLFRHLCIGDACWNPTPAANCATVATVVPPLLIGGAVLITVGAAFRARTELWVAAGVCLSVLAVPIAEEHQFVLLGIPMILVLQVRGRGAEREGASSWWPWLAFSALFVVPLGYTANRLSGGWSALAAYPRLYAAWLLWGLTVREMLRDQRPDGSGAVRGRLQVVPESQVGERVTCREEEGCFASSAAS